MAADGAMSIIEHLAYRFTIALQGCEVMRHRIETPFDSIENAQQYIKLLGEAVAQAQGDIDKEIVLATDRMSYRRLEALRMVEYNLDKLKRYLTGSGRALNDLRSLRRLLHEERPATTGTVPHKVTQDQILPIQSQRPGPLRARSALLP
jgi:hypothetical protein